MFQRKKNDLPTSMSLPGGYGGSGADGSGKAIKMDAPVVKAWKQSSGYTRWTYYILGFFVLLLFVGYRYLRYWNGTYLSLSLVCLPVCLTSRVSDCVFSQLSVFSQHRFG